MKIKMKYFVVFLFAVVMQNAIGQDHYQTKIAQLKNQKAAITNQEKEALKVEIESINERLEKKQITDTEAQELKEEVAKKRALNIENRIAIVDNEIALLERNSGDVLVIDSLDQISKIEINWGVKDGKNSRLFGVKFDNKDKPDVKYDIRTYSDVVFAIGLNNAIIDGQNLNDSPYKIGGSRFFEMGMQWRTRVLEKSNFLRLNYGFSFQFNGLKPIDNQYFVNNNGQTELQEFDYNLDKSKLRMDNLVFPIHLEFGPSKLVETDKKIRYTLYKSLRFGVGAYGGFNLSTRQKLKYEVDGDNVKDKLKRDYNTSNLIYGLSGYVGYGIVQLYAKYDLNPMFKDALVEQHNVSLGLRFDLD